MICVCHPILKTAADYDDHGCCYLSQTNFSFKPNKGLPDVISSNESVDANTPVCCLLKIKVNMFVQKLAAALLTSKWLSHIR